MLTSRGLIGQLEPHSSAVFSDGWLLGSISKEIWTRLALAATLPIRGDQAGAAVAVAEARQIEPGLNMSSFAPLVRHVPAEMYEWPATERFTIAVHASIPHTDSCSTATPWSISGVT